MQSVSIQRRVQWMDTDAAGIWHHSVIVRWVEEAEAEMHRNLGISDLTFGSTPRVKTEFEFASFVRFDDVVDITLTVTEVGRTSIVYDVDVRNGSTEVASGRMVAVFIDWETGGPKVWPDAVRHALTAG